VDQEQVFEDGARAGGDGVKDDARASYGIKVGSRTRWAV
jgi:hypothetical protein